MALTRQQKEARVVQTTADLKSATSLVFMTYNNFTVADAEELRGALAATGAKMRVLPKRLLRLIVGELKLEFDPAAHDSQLAVVWGGDAIAPAKALFTFAKTHENVQLLQGSLEGALLSSEAVKALAQLPGREELLGKLVGSLVSPLRGLQGVLTGAQRQLVYALVAINESKQAT